MKSIRDLASVIGLQGKLRTAEGLRVEVVTDDAREAYGCTDFRVTPLAGEGAALVTSHRIELESRA